MGRAGWVRVEVGERQRREGCLMARPGTEGKRGGVGELKGVVWSERGEQEASERSGATQPMRAACVPRRAPGSGLGGLPPPGAPGRDSAPLPAAAPLLRSEQSTYDYYTCEVSKRI